MGASMQMDSPMLVAAADVAPQDVLMADNDNKTFLFLRLQGLTAAKKREEKTINMSSNKSSKKVNKNSLVFVFFYSITLTKRKTTHENVHTSIYVKD